MSSSVEKRRIFYTNLLLLGFDPHNDHTSSRVAFNMDMFKVPNKAGFEIVAHYLFVRLNPARAKDEFRDCWPVLDKKREQTFRRVCNNWLTQIHQDEPEAHLPKIVPSIFQSPGGERFCNVMFAFSSYVLAQAIKNEHGVKSRDMLHPPQLIPQNLDFAPAMVQSIQCSVIDNRKKFFDRVQTRQTLHRNWKKTADDMMSEYRRLSRALGEREADIKSLLGSHSDKGYNSPVRMDRGGTRKPLTPASKHGKVFNVNVEAVKREEKVKKVRDMWTIVEGFLASSSDHQDVVSSILSGVVHKYVLNAADLDVRVPEMLLRECERELLKRDVGNTYKAGKLDLVSVLHLWNLSMHLYLEKFEECDNIDLSLQLADLQPKVHSQNSQLVSSEKLATSLRDQLIPELKESVRELKEKYHSKENDYMLTKSKLGMSLQPNTPPLQFDPSLASAEDLQATKMTFTPDMFPQESTPDAVARIMKSVTMKPQRLACSDVTNKGGTSVTTPTKSSAGVSPLAQGKMSRIRRGRGDLSTSMAGDENTRSSHIHSPVQGGRSPAAAGVTTPRGVEVSRVGSRQMTKVVRELQSPRSRWGTTTSNEGAGDSKVFSPDNVPQSADMSLSELRNSTQKKSPKPSSRTNSNTPTSSRPKSQKKGLSGSSRKSARDQSQHVAESPSDVLAARIAQSIIEEGEADTASPAVDENVLGDISYPYNVSNVLDELGVSGFVKRDKIARTPEADSYLHTSMSRAEADGSDDGIKGRQIFATPVIHKLSGVISESDGEDRIITVETQETRRSSYSEESGDISDTGVRNSNNHNLADISGESTGAGISGGTTGVDREESVRVSSGSPAKSTSLAKSPKAGYRLVESPPPTTPNKITKVSPAEARCSLSYQSLKEYVSWTPVSSKSPAGSKDRTRTSIGRMIVDSVLDEQPLFYDSPVVDHSSGAIGADADLFDLLPQSSSDILNLQGSAGFTPSFREHLQAGSTETVTTDTDRQVPVTEENLIALSSTSSDEGESAAKADVMPSQMTMDQIMQRYEKLKNTSVVAPSGRSGLLSPLAEQPTGQEYRTLNESISLQDETEPDFMNDSL